MSGWTRFIFLIFLLILGVGMILVLLTGAMFAGIVGDSIRSFVFPGLPIAALLLILLRFVLMLSHWADEDEPDLASARPAGGRGRAVRIAFSLLWVVVLAAGALAAVSAEFGLFLLSERAFPFVILGTLALIVPYAAVALRLTLRQHRRFLQGKID